MGRGKETDILSASEIGQYHFCSVAWYLQRCGYEPESPMLDIGTKKHAELGRIMDQSETKRKKGNIIGFVGYIILISAILIILFGVVL